MKDLKVLDLDLDSMFMVVEDDNFSDLDGSGSLDLSMFLTDEILEKEGIPLTINDFRELFLASSDEALSA